MHIAAEKSLMALCGIGCVLGFVGYGLMQSGKGSGMFVAGLVSLGLWLPLQIWAARVSPSKKKDGEKPS